MHRRERILVVGTGLSGSVVARELADHGYGVSIIDRRNHVAGNCYDYVSDLGIRVHKYGPHIFHTSNRTVVDWLSRFCEWVDYEHKVVAMLADGRLVPFPPNRETLRYVIPENLADVFYRPYTKKMWGLSLEELNRSIINRVPMRDDDEDRYFPKDTFQKLPRDGYTSMVNHILDHPLIEVRLDTVFKKSMERHYAHVFNSMPIDEYFDFLHGELPYRSIKFQHEVIEAPSMTDHPVINYTDDLKFTRVTEWKNFPGHGDHKDRTLITREEPCDCRDNGHERYYPVNDSAGTNAAIYRQYKAMAPDHMSFIGRCGQYVYLNMDQAVSSALAASRRFIAKRALAA
jgi:UDP-galactopyranose mutase